MGQMVKATDTAGNVTTHDYDLAGNRVATTTPDGGKVTWGYDAQGKLITEQTPNLRTPSNTSITYDYDFGKLVKIDYPDATPDVSYTYGVTGDPHNGAGRVIREEDGARIVKMEYSESGAMTNQLSEMKYHDWFNDDRQVGVPDHHEVDVRRPRPHRDDHLSRHRGRLLRLRRRRSRANGQRLRTRNDQGADRHRPDHAATDLREPAAHLDLRVPA